GDRRLVIALALAAVPLHLAGADLHLAVEFYADGIVDRVGMRGLVGLHLDAVVAVRRRGPRRVFLRIGDGVHHLLVGVDVMDAVAADVGAVLARPRREYAARAVDGE